MAPETQWGNSGSRPADVWSYGLTVLEMYNGQQPYFGLTVLQMQEQIKAGTRPPVKAERVPDFICVLVEECCRPEPQERPAFAKFSLALSTYAMELARNPAAERSFADRLRQTMLEVGQQKVGLVNVC